MFPTCPVRRTSLTCGNTVRDRRFTASHYVRTKTKGTVEVFCYFVTPHTHLHCGVLLLWPVAWPLFTAIRRQSEPNGSFNPYKHVGKPGVDRTSGGLAGVGVRRLRVHGSPVWVTDGSSVRVPPWSHATERCITGGGGTAWRRNTVTDLTLVDVKRVARDARSLQRAHRRSSGRGRSASLTSTCRATTRVVGSIRGVTPDSAPRTTGEREKNDHEGCH